MLLTSRKQSPRILAKFSGAFTQGTCMPQSYSKSANKATTTFVKKKNTAVNLYFRDFLDLLGIVLGKHYEKERAPLPTRFRAL